MKAYVKQKNLPYRGEPTRRRKIDIHRVVFSTLGEQHMGQERWYADEQGDTDGEIDEGCGEQEGERQSDDIEIHACGRQKKKRRS